MIIRHFKMEINGDLLTYLHVIRGQRPLRGGSQRIERRDMQVRIDNSF